MPTKTRFQIIYYEDRNGRKPVRDSIQTLDKKVRAKIIAYLTLLEDDGFLPFPYTSDITGVSKLRELRIQFSRNFHRIFYFLYTGEKNNPASRCHQEAQESP